MASVLFLRLMTLKEKAAQVSFRSGRYVSPDYPAEEVELAVAWVRGEVSGAQVSSALQLAQGTNTYAWLAPRLKRAFHIGSIQARTIEANNAR